MNRNTVDQVLVCQQDYTNSTEQILTKLGWRTGLSPEQTRLTFGTEPDTWKNPGFFFSPTLLDGEILTFFLKS